MRIAQSNLVSNALLALLFAAFCAVPLIGAIWSGAHHSESRVEKRRLADLPAWPRSFSAWLPWPKRFDAYATDRFGFRDVLLDGYKAMMTDVFRQSASPRAFIGKDGWLFLGSPAVRADMQGGDPYTDSQLRNIVQQINARGELLEAMHIRFGFMVAPDKHSVYPQYLPAGVYGGFSRRRLAALDRAMAATGHPYYTDISDAMRQASANSPVPLYYKSDTHWNHWGAYLGYQAWQRASGTWLDLHRFDYTIGQFWRPPGSITGDLGVMSGYQPFDRDIKPAFAYPCDISDWNAPIAMRRRLKLPPSQFRTADCSSDGAGLVIHDSFVKSMAPYLADNFQHVWMVWAYPDDAQFAWLVQTLHPDAVLIERVERMMTLFPQTRLAALEESLNLAGSSVELDPGGQLVVVHGGARIERSPMPVIATIDRISKSPHGVTLQGWADANGRPPAVAIAVINNRVAAEAPVALRRPDVAQARANPRLEWSGFALDLSIAELRSGPVQIYFIDYATYARLPEPQKLNGRLAVAIARPAAGADNPETGAKEKTN